MLSKAIKTLIERTDRQLERTFYSDALNTAQKKILGDTGVILAKLLGTYENLLETPDRIGIEQRLLDIADRFEKTQWAKYYVTFLQVLQALKSGDDDRLDQRLHHAQYDVLGTQVLFLASNSDYARTAISIYDVFFNRLDWVTDACKRRIHATNGLTKIELPSYVLPTITRTLLAALHSKDPAISGLPDLRPKLNNLSNMLRSLLKLEDIRRKPWLLAYLSSSLMSCTEFITEQDLEEMRNNLDFVASVDPLSLSEYQRSWVIINLWESKHPGYRRFAGHLTINKKLPAMSLAPFVLASIYLKYDILTTSPSKPMTLGIEPEVSKIEIEQLVKKLFPKIAEIGTLTISEKEKQTLCDWEDQRLRSAFAEIIASNPHLEEETRNNAASEAQKKHSGYEISDMDLPIHIDDQLHYVCLPFKSGREIRDKTVSTKVMSQLIRPYIRYRSGSCIFVTVKSCSVPLRNDINRCRQRGMPIYVIEGDNLCRLLKVYGRL